MVAADETFVDLGMSPLCESYLPAERLDAETFYPLHVRICDNVCWCSSRHTSRVKTIFSDYAYFSSYSTRGWSTPGGSSTTMP